VGADELSVIVLTDEERRRALSVVCDGPMTHQFVMRFHLPAISKTFLPEALLELMDINHEMTIYGIHNGQYQVVLADRSYERSVRIRMSDAVLLMVINHDIPLYIEETLMQRQCVPFDPEATGIAIPINTMDSQRLDEALRHAIEVENYELASHLRDEINRRKNNETMS
jgi:hypothetical protein